MNTTYLRSTFKDIPVVEADELLNLDSELLWEKSLRQVALLARGSSETYYLVLNEEMYKKFHEAPWHNGAIKKLVVDTAKTKGIPITIWQSLHGVFCILEDKYKEVLLKCFKGEKEA